MVFFFSSRRRHTRFKCDWSSDVCSSDLTWDETKPALPLFRQLVKDRVAGAMKARAEIQAAPDDTTRAIQEARHKALEGRLASIRRTGDAAVSAFFAADKPGRLRRSGPRGRRWRRGRCMGRTR